MSNKKPKGLGDSIEQFTSASGIKSLTNFLGSTGMLGPNVKKKGCGCNKRKEKLNNMFPYKK